MSVAIVTGSAGLIGSEATLYFGDLGYDVIGIDNDMRSVFFGPEGSTRWNVARLRERLGRRYEHHETDIRDREALRRLFADHASVIELVIHTAAQPSHDWAAREPLTDFDINAVGTLNLLEAARSHASEAPFLFLSTNKVYGDTPNRLPLIEQETRYAVDPEHPWHRGIPEEMSLDNSLHSIFGASKLAADVMVQEYGRYFGMPTVCFRGGTLTGPHHAAAELHGFLAYVLRCAMTGKPYTVLGYKGKQVRDVIHSRDLVRAFHEFVKAPRVGEFYNIGGGPRSHCSVLEAIQLAQEITGHELSWSYSEKNRLGDHRWWISDLTKFESHYPGWRVELDLPAMAREIHAANQDRWA